MFQGHVHHDILLSQYIIVIEVTMTISERWQNSQQTVKVCFNRVNFLKVP